MSLCYSYDRSTMPGLNGMLVLVSIYLENYYYICICSIWIYGLYDRITDSSVANHLNTRDTFTMADGNRKLTSGRSATGAP